VSVRSIARKQIAVLLLLAAWEAAPRLGLADPAFLPPFSVVMATIWEQAAAGELTRHAAISLFRAVTGFLIAVSLAVPAGLILGSEFGLADAFSPLCNVLSQANPFILFHIVLLFLGIGEAPKVAIIAWVCAWPVLFGSMASIHGVDPDLLRTGRAFGLRRLPLFWKVVLPAAAPAIFTALRFSAGLAFFVLIAAEMMGASSGLGWLVLSYQETYHAARIFAAATSIAILGLVSDLGLGWLERKAAFRGAEHF